MPSFTLNTVKIVPTKLLHTWEPVGDPFPTDSNDTLYGTYRADTIHGLKGDDSISGLGGDDQLFGDEGNDRLFGGTGNDVLDGGIGDDTLVGGTGADTLIGGAGIDTASYDGASKGVMLDLATGGVTNAAAGDTYSGIENVQGSAFGDIIAGNASSNIIFGGNGDDFLFGMAGNDGIMGGSGDDVLRGGAGNDILNGGDGVDRLTGDDAGFIGSDTFQLGDFLSGVDIVTDFQRGIDKLDVVGTPDFGSDGKLAVGSISGGWSNLDPATGLSDPADSLAYDPTSHMLYQVHWFINGSNGQSTPIFHEIAIIQDVSTLSAADFI
jgi:Ca2+-binding RTX toxin-like protein